MTIDDREYAVAKLRDVSYYRLSGYWYPFRKLTAMVGVREDSFFSGTTFGDVISLYDFDLRLRTAASDAYAPVELSLRAQLGHELGELDECAHLKPALLGKQAQGSSYTTWLDKYRKELRRSHEDFVAHHQSKYSGMLPVWAAVEILDLGSLRYLYSFSPRSVQDKVADGFGLSSPQLTSWMRSLEVVRNACAHHGRLYNRVYAIKPKLPAAGKYKDLDKARSHMTRSFGQLTLIQYMRSARGIGRSRVLSAILSSYPVVKGVPKAHVGMPDDWDDSTLWAG
ncbi:Abi family protein [Arthrobacter echini]|uniref:Abi family protein n=1 Tax=Arthrobacter echini TaxID=1529066 RepID=A0A5D0XH71_9MICC|nr:Abi family protein [Arthrobacter echini]TYC95972.1 Abi family protein [Arthrobacter echini]